MRIYGQLALAVFVVSCGSDAPGNSDCTDNDGDGVTTCDGDCNDDDPLSHPGANELCGDGADNNCDGQADEGCPGGIGTFVSAIVGNDSNPGTKDAPLATIAAGTANAVSIGGDQSVIVGEGVYIEKVTLAEGVDLQGGYACDATGCTWAVRDPIVHESLVQNIDFQGVLAGAGITRATLFEGLHVVGFDGVPPAPPGSVGVSLEGGSPTLHGNTIDGGHVTGGQAGADRSVAVAIHSTTDPAGALIDGNTLTGGTSPNLAAGLTFESFPAQTTSLATVTNNVIRGGTGRRSIGILAFNSVAGTLVSDNDISAGNSEGGASHGIEVGSHMTIDRNRINVDQTTVGTCNGTRTWCSGITSDSSTTTITNNIVFGAKGQRSAAVMLGEFEVAAGLVVLNANTLIGGGGGAIGGQLTESAALVVSIGGCTQCGFNGVVGHVRNNILEGGSNAARFGIREDPTQGKTMHPELIENNLFFFAPSSGSTLDVMYRQITGNGGVNDLKTVAAINMLTTPPASNNIAGDPMLDGAWHLIAGTPCANKGTSTEAPATDFEGGARPTGGAVDIGHDEMP